MIAATDVLEWGHERARAAPWRGQASIACLTPLAPGVSPTASFLRHCLAVLSDRGFQAVVTSALTPIEARGFLQVGFEEQERLRLLAHDLSHLPEAPKARLRRGRSSDRAAALVVDALAFEPFWQLDQVGFADAMLATPANRFRIAVEGDHDQSGTDGHVVGYAVSGRAGRAGYLQRLAVDPASARRGFGLALTVDALAWMRRRGVRRAVVNTQLGNEAALALYLRAGFRPESSDLRVLRYRLGG